MTSLLLAATFSGGLLMAQAIKEDFKPSRFNQPGQAYPQVNSQGYARFRVHAPAADSVKVSLGLGGRGGTVLTKGADGFLPEPPRDPWMKGFTIIILR